MEYPKIKDRQDRAILDRPMNDTERRIYRILRRWMQSLLPVSHECPVEVTDDTAETYSFTTKLDEGRMVCECDLCGAEIAERDIVWSEIIEEEDREKFEQSR